MHDVTHITLSMCLFPKTQGCTSLGHIIQSSLNTRLGDELYCICYYKGSVLTYCVYVQEFFQ